MNPEFKAKWIEALRSGKYEQTTQVLRADISTNITLKYGYCCLGVLCDIHPQVKWVEDDESVAHAQYNNGDSDYANLPVELREALNVPSNVESRLIRMNDDEGKDFEAIADYIERYL